MEEYKKKFQEELLVWYDNNSRELPWRDNPSPYRVWISEIMLQQTRVEAVKPYFDRFIEEIPDVMTLAEIEDDKLMKLWQGLGYYNRARNLKKAANIIINQYQGAIPDSKQELRNLPGIGDYSSGSIASIAFEKKTPAIDGNVLRVMARVNGNQGLITSSIVKAEIENNVLNLLPDDRIGDFNQALMELGAKVCLGNGFPKCTICPLQPFCIAYKDNSVKEIPNKPFKKARKIERKTVLILNYNGRIAINKRKKGLLQGMWEFPNLDGTLSISQIREYLKIQDKIDIRRLPESKFQFSHIEWDMIGYFVELKEIRTEFVWATISELLGKYSIPVAFRDYLNLIIKEQES